MIQKKMVTSGTLFQRFRPSTARVASELMPGQSHLPLEPPLNSVRGPVRYPRTRRDIWGGRRACRWTRSAKRTGVPPTDAAGCSVDPVPPGDRGRRSLHTHAPLTMGELHAHARWMLPVLAAFFVTLAVLAKVDALPWDRPIAEWIADHRTSGLNHFWRNVTELGGDRVVYVVVAVLVVLAWPRCRPLAIAILVLALARPVIVIVLKEIIARDRPPASLAITHPGGYSFPSGHPFLVAASWGFHPTGRRALYATALDLVGDGRRRVVDGGRHRGESCLSRCPLGDRRHRNAVDRGRVRCRLRSAHRLAPSTPQRARGAAVRCGLPAAERGIG